MAIIAAPAIERVVTVTAVQRVLRIRPKQQIRPHQGIALGVLPPQRTRCCAAT
jgi:hypothetical protein